MADRLQSHSAQPRSDRRIRRIAILGGGTAGWMAASLLARALHNFGATITVVESPDIGTVGVGEATIPPILDFLRFLDINEADFVRHTQATYKLGIRFRDWRRLGHSYWHPFGTFGTAINRRPFFHYLHKARALGIEAPFEDFSLCARLGEAGRFLFPDPAASGPEAGLRYALHFDAGLVARYLRAYAERLGVVRLERSVTGATRREDGFLEALVFTDESRLDADLFIDCSGFRGVLIERVLQTGYLDWTGHLPCDRAVALPTSFGTARAPFTQASARKAGWQWRIPLQHRAGNGYVYSSAHLSDEAALDDLLATVGEAPQAEPRFLRFVTGRRKRFWAFNCVALGLASGFLEPLESTSIHLVASGLWRLLEHFPDLDFDPVNREAYNRDAIEEMESIRDFIILHYCTTERTDSPLWRYCREMVVPDGLADRLELYRGSGRIASRRHELFTDLSWYYILDGMGIEPRRHDPLVEIVPTGQLREIFATLGRESRAAAEAAPSHDSYFAGRPLAPPAAPPPVLSYGAARR